MIILDPKDKDSFARVQEVIDRVTPEWGSESNVLGITPAIKVSGGKAKPGMLTIGFHVKEKVTPHLLEDRGYRAIPAEIDGIPTDVILARHKAIGSVDTKDTRSQMFDTLVGGIAVGNANMDVYGTLGMTLLANSDSRMVGLTNEHVLVFDGDGHAGDEVQQPRFFLNSEVSLDSASCCPNGTLHYRGVDNPIVDASAAVFAAAAIAAAASDKIDPHRRGQDATLPGPGERTLRETVTMTIDYPELPLPGRPYKLNVDWKYDRLTNLQTLSHAVSETKQNDHVIGVQELLTDKHQYLRGEKVIFTAILGLEPEMKSCGNYFVTAAALSQSHNRAYKIILKPVEGAAGIPGGDPNGQSSRRCFDFARERAGDQFVQPRTIDGNVYDPGGRTAFFIRPDLAQPALLNFPREGLTIRFPSPVSRVVVQFAGAGAARGQMDAFNGSVNIETKMGPVADIQAPIITHVVLTAHSREVLLQGLCIERGTGNGCVYRGEMQLAPNEELGKWTTYVFAQTRNDVPVGTEPTIAARTIGGLPVTANFVDVGETDSFIYGHACNVSLSPDGNFEVIASTDPDLG